MSGKPEKSSAESAGTPEVDRELSPIGPWVQSKTTPESSKDNKSGFSPPLKTRKGGNWNCTMKASSEKRAGDLKMANTMGKGGTSV